MVAKVAQLSGRSARDRHEHRQAKSAGPAASALSPFKLLCVDWVNNNNSKKNLASFRRAGVFGTNHSAEAGGSAAGWPGLVRVSNPLTGWALGWAAKWNLDRALCNRWALWESVCVCVSVLCVFVFFCIHVDMCTSAASGWGSLFVGQNQWSIYKITFWPSFSVSFQIQTFILSDTFTYDTTWWMITIGPW